MKKLLLTGIAALLLATGAAHAQPSKLPNEMMGEWCWDKFVDDDDDVSHYWREEDAPSCDDVLVLEQTRASFRRPISSMPPTNCEFNSIEVADPGTYRIRANCEQHWKFRACTHKSTTLIDVRLAPTSGAKLGCLRVCPSL